MDLSLELLHPKSNMHSIFARLRKCKRLLCPDMKPAQDIMVDNIAFKLTLSYMPSASLSRTIMIYIGYQSLLLWLTVWLSSFTNPTHTLATSAKPINSIHRREAINLDNLDILIPVGRRLVRGRPFAVASVKVPRPGDVTAIGDGICETSLLSLCSPTFCTTQTIVVYGASQQISSDIDCVNDPDCSISISRTITVTSTDALTIGGSADVNKIIEAKANIGWTHTWSNAIATAVTYTFAPGGARGHVIFVPFMLETCGAYTEYAGSFSTSCDTALVYDPMVCRQTPYRVSSDSSAPPAGVSTEEVETATFVVRC